MTRFALTAALGAVCLIAACDDGARNNAAGNDTEAEGNGSAPAAGSGEGEGNGSSANTSASSRFPDDARIVEEGGVTYRVNADGTRVRLGDGEARIVVENGVRYRVEPDGNRVRIDARGARIGIDLPDVDIGVNEKGNPDVDIGDRDPDGGR